MENFEISYVSEIEDYYCDNIDIIVKLGTFNITLVVTTPNYILNEMNRKNRGYVPAYPPEVIFNDLKDITIKEAIREYVKKGAYWLKVYGLAGNLVGAFNEKVMSKSINSEGYQSKEVPYIQENYKNLKILYPKTLNEFENIDDDEIEVIIRLWNNNEYILTISTIKFLENQINKSNKKFLYPLYPRAIVKILSLDNVKSIIDSFVNKDHGYWLHFYNYSSFFEFDIELMNKHLNANKLYYLAIEYDCNNNLVLAKETYLKALEIYKELEDKYSINCIEKDIEYLLL
ncbi:hypothetical protein [Romboutsia lituseburensis]|uniref:hypothetical protein n=1 Tax=Romboutsia lituseburensis TaxID=1537 RepID=UPI00215A7B8E|nr:hypothetical protein [Romboutsia lituseburensis]MCR8747233.1 hypothetical protein [Romboutsia lituseburensis]